MIRSMTGYGRGENISENRRFIVEIKSVNHRYNDITIKLPRSMNYLEDKIRKTVAQQIFRGKADVYVNFETFSTDDICVKMNEPLAKAYIDQLRYIEETYHLSTNDSLGIVAKFPDIITVEKVQNDEDLIWNTLLPALEEAIQKFIQMRTIEGTALKTDILKKSDFIKQLVDKIKQRAPLVILDYREKLKNRIHELLDTIEIDEQRLAVEVTLFADKGCIDEEIIRLESHITQLNEILNEGGLVGRKLDFLIQEMNREANTIASKANDIQITQVTIDLKSEIEKIREQIQNIE